MALTLNGKPLVYITGVGPGVASDTIWTSANQLVVSIGVNAAVVVPPGSSGQVLSIMSGGTVAWTSGNNLGINFDAGIASTVFGGISPFNCGGVI